MEFLIVWLIFAAIPAAIAPSRGRRWGVWLLISVLVSPLLGLILVVALPSKKAEQLTAAEAKDRRPCPRLRREDRAQCYGVPVLRYGSQPCVAVSCRRSRSTDEGTPCRG